MKIIGEVGHEIVVYPKPDHNTVTLFEQKIASFFGAPYAVATDSCTHGLELCLRYTNPIEMRSPTRTYLSVPMLANKLNIGLYWWPDYGDWADMYLITDKIIDAAVTWEKDSYIPGSLMCVSFQHQKHLSVGRLGVILCDSEQDAIKLRMLAHDGRTPGTPWREQNVKSFGFHYYAQPELCQIALDKLGKAIATEPRKWSYLDYPDLTEMDIFKLSK